MVGGNSETRGKRQNGAPLKDEEPLSPVYRGVLEENLVVPAQGDDEDDGLHVVEAVNPLAPLAPLPPDIHYAKLVLPIGDAGHHSAGAHSGRRGHWAVLAIILLLRTRYQIQPTTGDHIK